MYCVKCGVELADSQKQCPLCKTTVFHPELKQAEGESTYPEYVPSEPKANPKGVLFIVTCLMLIPVLITLTADLMTGGGITWSGYVVGGIALLYIMAVLPSWFKKPNPVVFIPVVFAAITLFLLYINLATGGHWFLSLAFPVTGTLGLILTAVAALTKYIKKGYLYIFGGAFALFGVYCVLIEIMVCITFSYVPFIFWSLYPCISLFIIGAMLITIAICKPLRKSLERKFFI